MKKTLIILAVLVSFLFTGVPASQATSTLPACAVEDGSYGPNPCYWDGTKGGTSVGHSYIIIGDTTTYTACMKGYRLFDSRCVKVATGIGGIGFRR